MSQSTKALKNTRTKRIRCLPIGKTGNPYQLLMMAGLREGGSLDVDFGAPGRRFAVIRTAARHETDVIHFDWIQGYFLHPSDLIAWPASILFILEVWIARHLLRRRIVWTMHNIIAHKSEGDRKVERMTRKAFARLCDVIRVFDASTVRRASAYLDLPEDRFVVCHEGSFIGYYQDDGVSKDEARRILNIEAGPRLLLYVGFIREYKGLDELVLSFKKIKPASWSLLLAGSPSDRSYATYISELVRGDDGIRLDLGFVDKDRLQFYFRAADAVVLPFRNIENSGSAVLAMGFGKPIVAPAKGNLPTRLQHQSELLFQDDILQGLNALLACDNSQLEEYGKENRRLAERQKWTDFAAVFRAIA